MFRKIILIISAAIVAVIVGILGCALFVLLRRPLVRFYRQRSADPDYCPYDEIPALFIHYLLEIEDDYFFFHHGIRFDMVKLALKSNKRARKVVSGGSTVTQQLIKNLYFRFEHNYLRKLLEAILTFYAEHALSKEQILELYLNIIYFGNGKYGIVDAAEFFFRKDVRDLTMNQQFMMACMPFAPTVGNPLKHPDVFMRVRDKRLNALRRRRVITDYEVECIKQYDDKCLDPELRECGEEERSYSDEIVLVNERFGSSKKKPM